MSSFTFSTFLTVLYSFYNVFYTYKIQRHLDGTGRPIRAHLVQCRYHNKSAAAHIISAVIYLYIYHYQTVAKLSLYSRLIHFYISYQCSVKRLL